MLLPKWLVIVLFIVAIGSTGGLLFLLTQRSFPLPTKVTKNEVVVVSATPDSVKEEAFVAPNASSSASPLSATDEWKKYTNSALNVRLEYPSNWFISASESGEIKISNYDTKTLASEKVNKDMVQVEIRREKKESTSQKLTSFLEGRLKLNKETNPATTVKEENNRTIDGYDATERLYFSPSGSSREIVFATRNYFYIISISPSDTLLKAGIDELLKTIEII